MITIILKTGLFVEFYLINMVKMDGYQVKERIKALTDQIRKFDAYYYEKKRTSDNRF